jgi:hypothetical protein
MRLVGCTNIDDALRRLDKVTQKEALVVAAQALDAAHHIHDEMIHVASDVEGIDHKMKDMDTRMKYLEGNMNPIWEILDSAQPYSMNYLCNPDILCRSDRSNGKRPYQYQQYVIQS